jgi:hypothetical protein
MGVFFVKLVPTLFLLVLSDSFDTPFREES